MSLSSEHEAIENMERQDREMDRAVVLRGVSRSEFLKELSNAKATLPLIDKLDFVGKDTVVLYADWGQGKREKLRGSLPKGLANRVIDTRNPFSGAKF